ncbi:hypothetical protein OROGR_006520 [Orobanche gracilis]
MSKMGIISHKYMFCLFLISSVLILFSRLLVLKSTVTSPSLDLNILPNLNLLDYTNNQILKVYMYDLPFQFHFGLMGWRATGRSIWPDIRSEVPEYPGGLNLQHSIEYWLTLDLLNSELPKNLTGCSAIRKPKPDRKSANDLLQEKLIGFLTAREEWKKSGGKDHVVVAHHPNSLLYARMKLWPAVFVLADFGRYPPSVANVGKDVIAPYKHLVPSYAEDGSGFDSRPILLYFQGAIYRKDASLLCL